jgi:hypothetical protein
MVVQDELATILGPSDERDQARSLRARVQRVAEQDAGESGTLAPQASSRPTTCPSLSK